MAARDVDEYLAGVDEPKRSTLEELRATLRQLLPDAEECISYGMPAFKVHGKAVAGFAAFKQHLGYFPHSSATLAAVPAAAGYPQSKGGLRFPIDQPLPAALVAQLVAARLAEIETH